MSQPTSTVMWGRIVLTIVALFTAVSPYLADWNETHIYNPHWPPHAKFHNGQTMAVAVVLGLATIWFAWRRTGERRGNTLAAGTFAAAYWVSQAAAFLFPGVAYTDPEFLKPGEALAVVAPQQILEAVVLAITGLGVALALRGTAESGRRADRA